MRPLLLIVAMATVPAWLGVSVTSASAQDPFNDRWSIIPKAHAEPAPAARDQVNRNSPEQTQTKKQPAQSSQGRATARSYNRAFSEKASFSSYANGKTASGTLFNRDAMTVSANPPPSEPLSGIDRERQALLDHARPVPARGR